MEFIVNAHGRECIDFIKSLSLDFDFIKYVDQELKNDMVSWIFVKEKGTYIAAHRSLIVDDNVLWRGLFVDQRVTLHTDQITILKFLRNYYSQTVKKPVLTYVDDTTKEKEFLIKKLGFKKLPGEITRFSLDAKRFCNCMFTSADLVYRELEGNESSNLMVESRYSYINYANWVKFDIASFEVLYLHYYKLNNILVIDDVVTQVKEINLVIYIKFLLDLIDANSIEYITVDIGQSFKISMLNLLMLKPRYIIKNVQTYLLDPLELSNLV